MNIPRSLQAGDKIAIVATARKISKEEIESATTLLARWGLVGVVGASIGLQSDQFAGTDQERAGDFQQQMDDPEIKAIWCARGGYGTVRMVDALDFFVFKKTPKWVIGYSDVTVLHSRIHQLGVATLHAPMPVDVMNATNKSVESMKNVLFGKKLNYKLKSNKRNRKGFGEGVLVGGNLSMMYSMCGSTTALDTRDKILFIEDLDEYLYHLDRMMQNLKRNGMLGQLKGLIVGSMTNMHDNTIPFGDTVEGIIMDTVRDYDYPVVFDFPAGHLQDNRALILGVNVTLNAKDKNVLLGF